MKRKSKRPVIPYSFGITPAKIQLAVWKAEVSAQNPPLKIKGVSGRWQCGVCGWRWDASCVPDECPECGTRDVHPN